MDEFLQIVEMDSDGNARMRCIPISAFGSWHVLLGSKTHAETMRAVVYVQDHPEPNGAWSHAYNELAGTEDNGIATTRELLGLPAAGYVKGLPALSDDTKAMLADHKDEIDASIAAFKAKYEPKG